MSPRSSSFIRRELRRRPVLWLASVLLSFVVAAVATVEGCNAASFSGGTGASGGGSSTAYASGAGGSDASVDVMPDSMPPPKQIDYSALCGTGCKPGSTSSCSLTGQGGASSASTSVGTGSSTSSTGSASTGSGASSSSASGASSSSGTGSTGTGSSGTGGSSSASGLQPVEPGCQVSAEGASPSGVCAPTGHSGFDGPCQTAADCSEGLGCVAVSSTGICRPYCCGSLEACGKGTYCTPLPMKERSDRDIPVCTPVTPCELFAGSCAGGETCTIVRADGTTSCVEKGSGTTCQPCPCAEGYMCSATGVCKKLCHTTPTNECGAGSTCQGGSTNFPAGIGICVGGAAECAPH